jgi:hypothetical protein
MGWAYDNLPLIGMYVLGTWLMLPFGWHWAVLYIAYSIASNLWFIKSICSHCVCYAKGTCPSGYGKLSARLSRKGDPKDFARAFNRNVPVVALGWVLPFVAGVLQLVFSIGNFRAVGYAAVELVIFTIVAFYVLPEMSKGKCRDCAMRKRCPGAKFVGAPKGKKQ